ncbi:hypothetical protein GTA09_19890 [Rhodococcus hoagii]|nr:hypothetical protein [Prescottella equi]
MPPLPKAHSISVGATRCSLRRAGARTWQASALLDVYTGESLTTVREKYQLAETTAADTDQR